MKTKEVTQILKALGWIAYTDDVGDKFTHYHLPDRIVQIIYGVRNFASGQQLEGTLSLSTDDFSKACASIFKGFGAFATLTRRQNGWTIEAPEITEAHVCRASEDAIAWAKEQDLDEALQEKIALPTSALGTGPVLHLGALAVAGDVEKLKSYQASFAADDRLGFVPYFTKEHIDRAVSLGLSFQRS